MNRIPRHSHPTGRSVRHASLPRLILRLILSLLAGSMGFNLVQAAPLLDTRYQYDALGNPTIITNAADQSERFTYDPLGRLQSHTNPLNGTTATGYNLQDLPVRVQTPNGAVTTWTTDGFGQPTAETSPDRGATQYRYDAAGNLIEHTDARGARIATTYDALNRPLERRFYRPNATLDATHVYTWDRAPRGIGRLDQLSAGLTQLTFDYDLAGHTTTRSDQRGSVTLTTHAQYHPTTGQQETLTYPSGRVLQSHYDATGRLSGITWDGQALATQIQYTALGAITTLQLANGLSHQRTYDTAGRITSYTLMGAPTLITYDAAGQLTALTPTDPARRQQFSYDAAGRLTGYQSPTHSEGYSYDPNGNRLTRSQNGQITTYQYTPNSNRLQSLNALAISHDAAGNRLLDLTRQYTHDSRGRLTQLLQGATLTRYEYNGLGERVFKQRGTEARYFVYDGQGHLLGEYDAQGQPLAEYAWLGDLPLAYRVYRVVNGTRQSDLYAIEADHLGTPRVLTDSAQRLRWQWHASPFGDTAPNENPANLGKVTFNLRFPGQYYDAESGLHYNFYRDYDPGTGRYVQSDPIGLRGGINTYTYVGNSPLAYADPYGLCPPEGWDHCRKACGAKGLMVKGCVVLDIIVADLWGCDCDENCSVDSYEDPGHHDPNGGPNTYNPTKETLPKSHKDLWSQSRPDPNNPDKTRWTKTGDGKNTVYHRFQNDGNGHWHWNGSSSGGTTLSGQPRSIQPQNLPPRGWW